MRFSYSVAGDGLGHLTRAAATNQVNRCPRPSGRLAMRVVIAIALAGLVAACAKPPLSPSPQPQPQAPQITCPAPLTLTSGTGAAITATYGTATVIGGASPITTACLPASGSLFALGTTAVTCTATDAQQRTSACSFPVQIQSPPRIRLTEFMAFGDSITAGDDGLDARTSSLGWRLTPRVSVGNKAYPPVLALELASWYLAQQPHVVNAGFGGEFAAGADTLPRFQRMLTSANPQAVLLMEGSNDILDGDPAMITGAVNSLRAMIGVAAARSIPTYLATVPPMNPDGARGRRGYATVPLLNSQIRTLAAELRVPLVEIFGAFNLDYSLLFADGLHPNERGYALIAETFFQSLKATLEVSGPMAAPAARTTSAGRRR
jgi:lysophospholipase L1-like esterase